MKNAKVDYNIDKKETLKNTSWLDMTFQNCQILFVFFSPENCFFCSNHFVPGAMFLQFCWRKELHEHDAKGSCAMKRLAQLFKRQKLEARRKRAVHERVVQGSDLSWWYTEVNFAFCLKVVAYNIL